MADRSPLIVAGAVDAALAVGLGAFAAHGLKDRLDATALAVFETGARYQMYHALAIVLCGTLVARYPAAQPAGWIFQLGIVLFSGSLYVMGLTGIRSLGLITPFGGFAMLLGWAFLALAGRRLATATAPSA